MKDLRERFNTSYTPIREALKQLEHEGLVEYRPRRSFIAAEIDVNHLVEVYDARRLFETTLAAIAAGTERPAGDYERLDEMAIELEEGRKLGKEDDWYELHRRFHLLLLKPATNSVIEQTISRWWAISERFHRLAHLYNFGKPPTPRVPHTEISRAAVDPERLKDTLRQHLRVTAETVKVDSHD